MADVEWKEKFLEVTPQSVRWRQATANLTYYGAGLLMCAVLLTLALFSYRETYCESLDVGGAVCVLSTQGIMAGPGMQFRQADVQRLRVRAGGRGRSATPSYQLVLYRHDDRPVVLYSRWFTGRPLDAHRADLEAMLEGRASGTLRLVDDSRPFALLFFVLVGGLGLAVLARARTRVVQFDGTARVLRVNNTGFRADGVEEIPLTSLKGYRRIQEKSEGDEKQRFRLVVVFLDGQERDLMMAPVEERAVHSKLESSLEAMGLRTLP